MDKPAQVQLQFASLGIGEMPAGVSELSGREMRFVLGVLEHGQMARAAVDAGYSVESAGQIASETFRKPKVLAFYRRCVDKVAGKAELVLRGCFERYVIFNAKALEAAQTLKDASEWLLAGETIKNGRNATDTKKFELARDRAMRDEKHYSSLARAEATLLLKAMGRMPEGTSVTVNVISDEARQQLAEIERAGVPIGLPTGGRN